MTNVTEETIALGRQLCALYVEAIGIKNPADWDDLDPISREAWVQVAQWIDALYIHPVPDHK